MRFKKCFHLEQRILGSNLRYIYTITTLPSVVHFSNYNMNGKVPPNPQAVHHTKLWLNGFRIHTLRKKVLYIKSIGFFTQLQRTFYTKKWFIMTRKNPFGTKVL